MENEEKLESLLKTAKAKMTAKADEVNEVKAIEKTLEEFRVEKNKPVDKRIETEAPLQLHFLPTSLQCPIFPF